MTKQEAIIEQALMLNQISDLIIKVHDFSRQHGLHYRIGDIDRSTYAHGDWSESDWESSAPDC